MYKINFQITQSKLFQPTCSWSQTTHCYSINLHSLVNRYLNKQKYLCNLFFYLLETWNFIESQKAFYKIWGLLNPSQVILNMLSVLTVELAKELVYWHYAVCLRNLSSSKLLHPHTGSTDNILVFQSSQIKHSRLTESPSKITS